MKLHPHSIGARIALAALLTLAGISLFCAVPLVGARQDKPKAAKQPSPALAVPTLPGGANPSSGSINATDTAAQTWVGTTISPGGNTSEGTCIDSGPGESCEVYTLTVNGTTAAWAGKKIQILLNWDQGNATNSANEYDIYIHQGSSTSGPIVASAINGPGLTNQVAYIDVPNTGTGVYTIHIAYDTTPTSAADEYQGSASVVPEALVGPPEAPQDTGPKIGYEIFEAPGVLQPATQLSSGFITSEYLGRGAGEPSIGANWNTGVINFQSDLQTEFVTFDDSCNLTNPKATWVNRRAPTSQFIDSDPIGFTDRQTGRVFAGELTLLSPTCKTSYTDDDGQTWIPTQGSGIASAVDHETIGGGPYHAPLNLNPPSPVYPHAVYYCSQDIAFASCSRSDDGGLTFGGSVPMYALTSCGGLHGHVKVAPDGTVYVPNRGCGANAAVVVSTDNGTTWTVRPVQNASVSNTATLDDPAVGIDSNGKVYFLGAMGNGNLAMIATSEDQGVTWLNIYNVGAVYNLQNIAFPAATAGDAGRAAVAFYGSVTGPEGGDSSADGFTGVWHLYVVHTFDGGVHWTTSDTTPTLPMQRMGLLRGGGGPMDRNLLDFFDVTVDRDGRVLVGYVDGCSGGPCSQAPIAADGSSGVTGNAYTATAAIARQSSGRRMLAANDPTSTTSVPGMPYVTEKRIGNTVTLAWNQSDIGNSLITSYEIFRSASPGGEGQTPYATLSIPQSGPNVNQNGGFYHDTAAVDATQTYYYRVVAVNGVGPSCANNEIVAPYVGDICSGVIIHQNLSTHPESLGGTATQTPIPEYLIDYIAVGEPVGTNFLMFKMKVEDLSTVPPNSRWRMVWNSVSTPDEQYYVGMTTDATSAVTFEYGTLPTQTVEVVGVPTENPVGVPDVSSNFNADGTITIYINKSMVGSPQPGDLLGAVNGRTFNTGDTPAASGGTVERSTLLVDHTFVKGNTDNSYPPATYALVGNSVGCTAGNIAPVGVVSRKTHGSAGFFDIDLPLTGNPGIECRTGPTAGAHTVVVTFSLPITALSSVSVSPGSGGTATMDSYSINNTEVIVNLTNVSNAQTLAINLAGVSDGTHSGDVHVPMGLLLGDVDGSGHVDAADVGTVQRNNSQAPTPSTFRSDVNTSGHIDVGDIGVVQRNNSTSL